MSARISGACASASAIPGVKGLVKHYVLHDFDAEEKPEVETMVGAIADNFALLFERGHEHFMTKVALAINPPPPKPPRAGEGGRRLNKYLLPQHGGGSRWGKRAKTPSNGGAASPSLPSPMLGEGI